ncbi:hypothetical protein IMX07_10255 [bacterium]|nr:hypothetical protein [bacterium]
MRKTAAIVTGLLIAFSICAPRRTQAADLDATLAQWRLGTEADGSLAHFGPRLNQTGWIQAWNLAAHFTVLPLGVVHFHHLDGVFDGAVQLGVGPVFERFNTEHQNFGGLDFEARYYLTRFAFGPLVPWVQASIAPGGTDLNIGELNQGTRLRGPFAALIQGGAGFSYFFSERGSVYAGLHTQHVSNGAVDGGNRYNYSINTPVGMIAGFEWFLN